MMNLFKKGAITLTTVATILGTIMMPTLPNGKVIITPKNAALPTVEADVPVIGDADSLYEEEKEPTYASSDKLEDTDIIIEETEENTSDPITVPDTSSAIDQTQETMPEQTEETVPEQSDTVEEEKESMEEVIQEPQNEEEEEEAAEETPEIGTADNLFEEMME